MAIRGSKPNKFANIPHFRGVSRMVTRRIEPGQETKTRVAWWSRDSSSYLNYTHVLEFRLEVTDQSGNIVSSKQVVLEGKKIFGVICEGDEVEVFGEEDGSGIYNPLRIFNFTTGTEIATHLKNDRGEFYELFKFFDLNSKTEITKNREGKSKHDYELIAAVIFALSLISIGIAFGLTNS